MFSWRFCFVKVMLGEAAAACTYPTPSLCSDVELAAQQLAAQQLAAQQLAAQQLAAQQAAEAVLIEEPSWSAWRGGLSLGNHM